MQRQNGFQKQSTSGSFNGKTVLRAVVGLFLLSAFLFVTSEAYALRISMKRIIFEGKKRTEILTIINNTPQEQIYRIQWRRYRMKDGGGLVSVKEGEPDYGVLWADDMVRFAPRRVKIPPGSSQQIRLLLRRPSGLEEGEYRAHIWVTSEAPTKKFVPGGGGAATDNFSVKLSVLPGMSLPLFVRHGDLKAEVSLSDAKLSRDGDEYLISYTINRSGNRSVYGDFEYICTGGGKDFVLRQQRGIAVYPEASYKNASIKIAVPEKNAKSCNVMKIVYRADRTDSQYKGGVMGEVTVRMSK